MSVVGNDEGLITCPHVPRCHPIARAAGGSIVGYSFDGPFCSLPPYYMYSGSRKKQQLALFKYRGIESTVSTVKTLMMIIILHIQIIRFQIVAYSIVVYKVDNWGYF